MRGNAKQLCSAAWQNREAALGSMTCVGAPACSAASDKAMMGDDDMVVAAKPQAWCRQKWAWQVQWQRAAGRSGDGSAATSHASHSLRPTQRVKTVAEGLTMWVVGQGTGMNAAPQQAGLAVGTAGQVGQASNRSAEGACQVVA